MPTRHAGPRRVEYPDQRAYPGAYIMLPAEWVGDHLVRRDAAVMAAAVYKNERLTVAAICIALIDEWGGLPGLEGDDPAGWNFGRVPVPLLRWLELVIYADFMTAFEVPKVYSSPSLNGPAVTKVTGLTAGGSKKPRRPRRRVVAFFNSGEPGGGASRRGPAGGARSR